MKQLQEKKNIENSTKVWLKHFRKWIKGGGGAFFFSGGFVGKKS